ncbi:hypothetical protein PPACK8108_LOCUS22200 [Phakopsora pachyrhizi]|uniref:Zn(2)-C6 fungal-type domain-containing protein n=1 Tax=Phakopsora pachyrhizi TaxID=170000 RepID=A0AAV0BN46_PHAPC|nr:hypothetical protein PPACK8108_LOCUS22200 [Phakopsora pachyrhizi]
MPPDWILKNVINPPEIGPPPSTHSKSPPFKLRDFNSILDDWINGTNGFTKVHQYESPCRHCSKLGYVCCQATVGRSKKCEACRVMKRVCEFDSPQVFSKGRKVWCNPSIKAYGYEAPFPEVPTSDYDWGIISTLPSGKTQLLRTVGVPPDEITITKNKEVFGIRIRQREADSAVVEDVNNMSPRAHIRHVQQAQKAQETVQNEINKEVEALRGNKAMATEDNLIEMMDNEEPGRAANFQSQDWLVDKVDPEFVNLTNVNYSEEVIGLFSRPAIPQMNPSQLLQMPSISQLLHPHLLQISNSGIEDSLRWSFGSPPTRKEDFNQDKQVALRKLFNQHLSVGECVKKLVNMASGKKYGEAYKLGTQLNDEMGKTFCSLSGWFESLEVEDYEPFDWGDSKGKRKDDCSLE